LEEPAVGPRRVFELGDGHPDQLGGLPVDLEVLGAAEVVVVEPAGAGDGRINTRRNGVGRHVGLHTKIVARKSAMLRMFSLAAGDPG